MRVTVRKALEKQLLTLIDDLPFDFENGNFNPPDQAPWVRAILAVTMDGPAAITSGPKKIEGLLMVDLFYPKNAGPRDGETMCDVIVAGFDPSLTLTEDGKKIFIDRTQSHQALDEPQWWQIPVTIKWYAYY